MGKLIFLLLTCFTTQAIAQNVENALSIETTATPTQKITDVNKAKQIAENWLLQNKLNKEIDIKTEIISVLNSAISTHFRFQLLVNNLPIYGGQIKIKVNLKSKALLSISASNYKFDLANEKEKSSTDYLLFNEELFAVKREHNIAENGFINSTNFIGMDGEIMLVQNHNSNKSDTTATVQVFYPEPLTSAKQLTPPLITI